MEKIDWLKVSKFEVTK